MNENEKLQREQNDYLRTIVAHQEANRRLKIKKIENKIDDAKKGKILGAIAAGVGVVAAIAIAISTGGDVFNVNFDYSALSSGDIQNFFRTAVPREVVGAMGGSVLTTALGYIQTIVGAKKQYKAERELNDMILNNPKMIEDDMKQEEEFHKLLDDTKNTIARTKEIEEQAKIDALKTEKERQDNLLNEVSDFMLNNNDVDFSKYNPKYNNDDEVLGRHR